MENYLKSTSNPWKLLIKESIFSEGTGVEGTTLLKHKHPYKYFKKILPIFQGNLFLPNKQGWAF